MLLRGYQLSVGVPKIIFYLLSFFDLFFKPLQISFKFRFTPALRRYRCLFTDKRFSVCGRNFQSPFQILKTEKTLGTRLKNLTMVHLILRVSLLPASGGGGGGGGGKRGEKRDPAGNEVDHSVDNKLRK